MGTNQKSLHLSLQIITGLLTVCIHHGTSVIDNDLLRLSHTVLTGDEGSEIKVDCHALVKDTPQSLNWSPEDGITQWKSSDGKSVRLTISSLHRYDAGKYGCFLTTATGDMSIAEVHVYVRPRNGDVQTCRTTQFKCKVTKDCIFLKYRCDGKDDCGDGSDEECSGDPCANRFICNNTRCVDHTYRCDHVDNCGDNSDERACYEYWFKGDKASTTADPNGVAGEDDDDDNYSWVKSTIYTIIASTIGLVILISIGVILVFRAKMKRIRERRMVRALNAMQIYGGPEEPRMPPMTGDGCVEEEPFLPRNVQRYHQGPSIIFNVNNGVQYMPRYRYFVENPPPYSEVQGGGSGSGGEGDDRTGRSGGGGGGGRTGGEQVDTTPPPYSTLDRSNEAMQEVPGTRNSVTNRDQNRNNNNNQRGPRSHGLPLSNGANNLPTTSDRASHSCNSNSAVSSSSTSHTARACEWGRGHSGSEFCTGCVHCVPSSSAPQATNNAVVIGTDLHRDEWPGHRVERINHHPSLSQGQGPVVMAEGRQQRGNERNERSPANTQLSRGPLAPTTNLNGSKREFRGVDINSHFLQNLLTSSSSSRNDSHRLTASVDSESCSNESHGSAASSSSSCGDDSVSSHTLLGIAGPSGTGRDSIHEVQTLKTRDRDVPCLPHNVEPLQCENQSLPVANDNDNSLISAYTPSNSELQPNLGAYGVDNSNNDNDNTTTIATNNTVNDISSLPNSNSEEVDDSCSGVIESNEHQHLLNNEDQNSPLQSHTVTDICDPSVPSVNSNNDMSPSSSSNQTTTHPQSHGSIVTYEQDSSQIPPASTSLLPSSADLSSGNNNVGPSSALLQEVANREKSNCLKAKQGHLSVHKGQIVLHTSDGVLAGQSIIPIVPVSSTSPGNVGDNSPTSGETTAMPHLSGEIIVKDGNIMLQIPVGKSLMPTGHVGFPCMKNVTQQQQQQPSSPSSSSSKPFLTPDEDQSRFNDFDNKDISLPTLTSSECQPEVSRSVNQSAQASPKCGPELVSAGGDLLRIRDGQLVLEPPQPKTPSSQILSHLQGAECLSSSLSGVQEEEDGLPVGPVVNDKRHRSPANVASGYQRHHQPSAKSCNSDIVLPRGGMN